GAAEVLFPTSDPVGRTVSLDCIDRLRSFTVVGVAEPKTLAAGDGAGDTDYSRVVFIPFATDRARLGRELISLKTGSFSIERLEISQITVTVGAVADVP